MNYFLAKTLIALVLLNSFDVAMAQTTTLYNDSIKESTSPRILTNKKLKKESPSRTAERPNFVDTKNAPLAQKPYKEIKTTGTQAPSIQVDKYIRNPYIQPDNNSIRVVEFWATWCPPCRTTIPKITKLQKKYVNNNVVFLGISNEDDNTVSSFVSYMGGQMVYAIGLDESRATSRAFSEISGASTIPHAYILSPDNKILWDGNPASGSFEIALREAITLRDLDS